MIPRILRGLLHLISIYILGLSLLWPTSIMAAPHLDSTIYLPIIISPILVSAFQFETSSSCSTDVGNPVASPASFLYGLKQLGVSSTVNGGVGQPWRLEWTIGGQRQTDLDRSGTIAGPSEVVAMTVVYGVNGLCGEAVPRGTYQVRLFLSDSLYQEATATIH
jgi:hypothetical protein